MHMVPQAYAPAKARVATFLASEAHIEQTCAKCMDKDYSDPYERSHHFHIHLERLFGVSRCPLNWSELADATWAQFRAGNRGANFINLLLLKVQSTLVIQGCMQHDTSFRRLHRCFPFAPTLEFSS